MHSVCTIVRKSYIVYIIMNKSKLNGRFVSFETIILERVLEVNLTYLCKKTDIFINL